MFIHPWNAISKRFQGVVVIHYRRTKPCAIQAADKLTSERGLTLIETIMITVVAGMLLAVFLPTFLTSLQQGTKPEIYATALYIAQEEIEKKKRRWLYKCC